MEASQFDQAEGAAAAAPRVSWLCLGRGLSQVFWGLALAIVLLIGQAWIDLFQQRYRIPAYVAGAVLALWGLWRMRDAGVLTSRWRARLRGAIACAALLVYFAPFTAWWKAMPGVPLYALNLVAFLLAGMILLLLVNLLAADVFARLEARGARVEAWLAAAGVAIMMMAPLLIGAVFSWFGALRYGADFAPELAAIVSRVPAFLVPVLLLPCSLSLVCVWKARTLCYHRIWRGADGPGGNAPPPLPGAATTETAEA